MVLDTQEIREKVDETAKRIAGEAEEDPEQLLRKGQLLVEMGHFIEASKILSQAAKKADPNRLLKVLFEMALLNSRRGDAKQAIDLYKTVVDNVIEATDGDLLGTAWNNLGMNYRKLGWWAEGLEASRKALEYSGYKSPKDAHMGIANSLQQLGQPAEAILHLEEVLRLSIKSSDIVTALHNLGEAYLLLGRYDQAYEILQKGQREATNHEDKCWGQLLLVLLFLTKGDIETFEKEYKRLAELVLLLPNKPRLIYYTNSLSPLLQKSPLGKRDLLESLRRYFEYTEELDVEEVQRLATLDLTSSSK